MKQILEKRRQLRAATLLILPSYIEGVPISLLEAMAAGLPSVATPVGGVLDAVSAGRLDRIYRTILEGEAAAPQAHAPLGAAASALRHEAAR